MTDRYAVFGNPIAHSRSPAIHHAFARQTGEDLVYEARLAPLDGFAEAVREFARGGGRGANVTLPFKEEAFRLAARRSARAAAARAVNTLRFDPEGMFGDNTDGAGLVADIVRNHDFAIAARRVLLLGAGGAARGVLLPLLEQAPACLVIANRTPERARRLCEEFAGTAAAGGLALPAGGFEGVGFPAIAGREFDLVINASSSGIAGEAPPLPAGVLATGGFAYDMSYGPAARPFLELARALGAERLADGLGMLVEQAAEAFLVWRGVRPETGGVRLAVLQA